jgi:hypothetical protein
VQAADTGSYSCYVISDYYTAQYSQVFKDAAYRADDLSKAARLSLGSCTGGGGPVVVQPEGPLPWRLYPNPAYPGQEVTLKGYKNYTGRLFSLSGQLLRVFYINADTYRLPAPAVKGMYLLHCEQDHIYNYEKLLVQ